MADLDVILGLVEDIRERVDEVNGKCTELLEYKAVHTETHKALDGHVATFKKTLFGDDNGTGLTYRVDKLMQCKDNLKSSTDRWNSFFFGLLRTLATAAIIAVTAWLLCMYRDQGVQPAAGAQTTQPRSTQGP
jgi:hypothetical protein